MLALLTSFRRGLLLALAAIPPLLLIPIYNWICFGGPLSFGYHHLALTEFQQMNNGLFGITFPPKASAAYLILFSPARGLFFWTPFFVMALLGVRSLARKSHRLLWVFLAVVISHVICISGYYMPDGGAALGPRHLAPMLPFLAPIAAIGLSQYSQFGFILGYCSIVLTGLATLITAMPWQNFASPLQDVFPARLLDGKIASNGLAALGMPAYWGMGLISILFIVFYFASGGFSRKEDSQSSS